mmetsp:Transcript_388/g.993  ORF Transcript_388/g.993 Transcript_388/m.993 type:complete len:256 (+) Transcript_388:575-1342(+)
MSRYVSDESRSKSSGASASLPVAASSSPSGVYGRSPISRTSSARREARVTTCGGAVAPTQSVALSATTVLGSAPLLLRLAVLPEMGGASSSLGPPPPPRSASTSTTTKHFSTDVQPRSADAASTSIATAAARDDAPRQSTAAPTSKHQKLCQTSEPFARPRVGSRGSRSCGAATRDHASAPGRRPRSCGCSFRRWMPLTRSASSRNAGSAPASTSRWKRWSSGLRLSVAVVSSRSTASSCSAMREASEVYSPCHS